MTEPTLMTAADISRLAGVNRATVSNWRRRHADFPAPAGGTDASPAYDRAEVEAWLSARDSLPKLPPEERLWRAVAETGKTGSGDLGDAVLRLARAVLGGTAPTYGLDDGQALGSLLDRYADAAGVPVTPSPVAGLMAALADPDGGVVLDLACGTGELLAAAARQHAASAFGQELDASLAELAGIRLGLEAKTTRLRDSGVITGDSLRDDKFVNLSADVVLCHPPFGERDWGQEELAHDPRWTYGIPPKNEPELAWAQAALAHLKPGGLAVMLMPPALASRSPARRIRAELVRRGVIRAIIALPAGVVRPQHVPVHLWIMERPGGQGNGQASGDPRVLFINTTQFPDDDHDQDETWRRASCHILDTWRLFRGGAGDDAGGYGAVVRAIDLLDDDVDLSPARHGAPPEESRDPVETAVLLKALRQTLRQALQAAAEDLPQATWPAADVTKANTEWRMVTVADLDRTRTATIQRASSKAGQALLQAEDVIIPAIGANAPVRGHVVTKDEAGTELPPNTHLIRPDPARIDPWFLAGFLAAPASVRNAAYGTNGSRIEVRRLTVPVLPLPDQRKYGVAFRRLEGSEALAREIVRVTEDLTELIRNGLRETAIFPGDGSGT